jgi:hypothetical protein
MCGMCGITQSMLDSYCAKRERRTAFTTHLLNICTQHCLSSSGSGCMCVLYHEPTTQSTQ